MNFFANLCNVFGLYGQGLHEHLMGIDKDCNYTEASASQSIYILVFFCLLIINSLIMVNYYYGSFNRPKFSKIIYWLLNVLLGSIFLFAIAFFYTNNDLEAENFCDQLIIYRADCIGFGITVAIYSIVWSLIFSVIIKFSSKNNKKIPF